MNGNHEVTDSSKRTLRILASLFAALGIVVSLHATTMAQGIGPFERKGGKFVDPKKSKEENRRLQAGPESTPTNVSRGDSTGDILPTNGMLQRGQRLVSKNGQFIAVYQTDGDFVLYGRGGPLWRSQTSGRDGDRLVMQGDGNLVIYKGPAPVWATNTAGGGAAYLVMQDDGNLVIYKHGGGPLWASSAAGPAPAPTNVMARATPTSQQPTVQPPSAQQQTVQTRSAMTIAASPIQQSPQPPPAQQQAAQPAAQQSLQAPELQDDKHGRRDRHSKKASAEQPAAQQPPAQRSLIQRSPAQPAAPTTSATISAASLAQQAQQAVQQPVTFSTWEALWRHIWAKANRTGRIRAASTVLYEPACQGDMNVIAAIVEQYIRAVRDRKYGDAVRYLSEFQDKSLCLTQDGARGVEAALAFFTALAAEQLPQAEARTAVQGAFNLGLLAFDQVLYTQQSWWPVVMSVDGATIAPLLVNYPDAELGLWVYDFKTGRLEQHLDERFKLLEHLRNQPDRFETVGCNIREMILTTNFRSNPTLDCFKGPVGRGKGGSEGTKPKGSGEGGVPGLGDSPASCLIHVAQSTGMRGMMACMDKAVAGPTSAFGSFDVSASVRDPQFSTPNPQCTRAKGSGTTDWGRRKDAYKQRREAKERKDREARGSKAAAIDAAFDAPLYDDIDLVAELIPVKKDENPPDPKNNPNTKNRITSYTTSPSGGSCVFGMGCAGGVSSKQKQTTSQPTTQQQTTSQQTTQQQNQQTTQQLDADCKKGIKSACDDLAKQKNQQQDPNKQNTSSRPDGPNGGGCGSNAAAWARAMYQCVAGPPLDRQLKPFSPGGGTGPIARYPGEGGEGGPGGGQSAGFLACMQISGTRVSVYQDKCTDPRAQCDRDHRSGLQGPAVQSGNAPAARYKQACNPGPDGSCEPPKGGEGGEGVVPGPPGGGEGGGGVVPGPPPPAVQGGGSAPRLPR